ncbi:hypothetical protein ACHAWF_015295 [Thalassiosira exigua]
MSAHPRRSKRANSQRGTPESSTVDLTIDSDDGSCDDDEAPDLCTPSVTVCDDGRFEFLYAPLTADVRAITRNPKAKEVKVKVKWSLSRRAELESRRNAATSEKFDVDEKIFAYDREVLYEARIMKCKECPDGVRYHVHYLGYKKCHDKWLSSVDMLKWTPSNLKVYRESRGSSLDVGGVKVETGCEERSKPETVKSSDNANASGVTYDQDDYATLRERYLTPRVREKAELASGITLRRQTKGRMIDQPSVGFRLLRTKVDFLLRKGDHPEVYRLLCQLRNWEMDPSRVPAVCQKVVGADAVAEFLDLTGEDDNGHDQPCIDVDEYITDVLLVGKKGGDDEKASPSLVQSSSQPESISSNTRVARACLGEEPLEKSKASCSNVFLGVDEGASVEDGLGDERGPSPVVSSKRSQAEATIVSPDKNSIVDEEEYASLRRRYLMPRVREKAALAGSITLRRRTRGRVIDQRSPGFQLLKVKVDALLRKSEHSEVYRLLRQLRKWETNQLRVPTSLQDTDDRGGGGGADVLDLTEDDGGESVKHCLDVDHYITDVLLADREIYPLQTSSSQISQSNQKEVGKDCLDGGSHSMMRHSCSFDMPEDVGQNSAVQEEPYSTSYNGQDQQFSVASQPEVVKSNSDSAISGNADYDEGDYADLRRRYLMPHIREKVELASGMTLRRKTCGRVVDKRSPGRQVLRTKVDALLRKNEHTEVYRLLSQLRSWEMGQRRVPVTSQGARSGGGGDDDNARVLDLTIEEENGPGKHCIDMDDYITDVLLARGEEGGHGKPPPPQTPRSTPSKKQACQVSFESISNQCHASLSDVSSLDSDGVPSDQHGNNKAEEPSKVIYSSQSEEIEAPTFKERHIKITHTGIEEIETYSYEAIYDIIVNTTQAIDLSMQDNATDDNIGGTSSISCNPVTKVDETRRIDLSMQENATGDEIGGPSSIPRNPVAKRDETRRIGLSMQQNPTDDYIGGPSSISCNPITKDNPKSDQDVGQTKSVKSVLPQSREFAGPVRWDDIPKPPGQLTIGECRGFYARRDSAKNIRRDRRGDCFQLTPPAQKINAGHCFEPLPTDDCDMVPGHTLDNTESVGRPPHWRDSHGGLTTNTQQNLPLDANAFTQQTSLNAILAYYPWLLPQVPHNQQIKVEYEVASTLTTMLFRNSTCNMSQRSELWPHLNVQPIAPPLPQLTATSLWATSHERVSRPELAPKLPQPSPQLAQPKVEEDDDRFVSSVQPKTLSQTHSTLHDDWKRQNQMRRKGEWVPQGHLTGSWKPPKWVDVKVCFGSNSRQKKYPVGCPKSLLPRICSLVERFLEAMGSKEELSVASQTSLNNVICPGYFEPTMDLVRNAHIAIAGLLPPGDCEEWEVVKLARQYYNYWRPKETKIILLAESHAFTTRDRALHGPGLAKGMLKDSYLGPRGYLSLVYCLAYGEILNDNIKQGAKGTPQFWTLFGACARGVEYVANTNSKKTFSSPFAADLLKGGGLSVEERLEAKLGVLEDLRRRGVWLLDASVFGWYMTQPQVYSRSSVSQEVHRKAKTRPPKELKTPSLVLSWELFTKHLIHDVAEEGNLKLLIPIGMEVEKALTASRMEEAINGSGARLVETFPAPNAWIPGGYGPFHAKLAALVNEAAPPLCGKAEEV